MLLPMLIAAVVIRAESRGGAIFRQRRVGRGGKVFVCYKFRTMYIDAPKYMPSQAFEDRSKYVTRVGKFLRRTSFDELPQLFNVLKGDMSLVGPRPLICEEGRMHEERLRHGVYSLRPGMTGMAQINGRNAVCDEEKLGSDCFYLENIKMRLDVKILFATVAHVFKGEGVE